MRKITPILLLLFAFSTASFSQNALSFDGTDDKVDLGNPPELQITGTAITIEAWIYPTSWRLNVWEGDIVVKEQPIHGGYMFRAGENGKLNFAWGNGTTWNELTTAANQLSLNVWQHVAATYDGQMVRLYKNGVRIDSTAYTGNIVTNSNSCVIGGWFSTGRNFPGKIDEVRIWDVTRTQAEIASSMYGEFCGAPTGLQGYYKFNQGTAGGSNSGQTTLTDLSGNGNHGTLQNFALSGATSNWTTGAALTAGTGGSGSATVNACDSYTSPSGKYTWTTNGTYIDTITSPLGCDSVVTITLTLQQSSSANLTETACNSYKSPSGKYVWKTTGNYTDTLTNAVGCDSILNINLTINNIDTNVLVNNNVLTSYQNNAAYQWVDCNNNYQPIAGANMQVFHPQYDGSYAVIVSDGSCSDTSACYVITGLNIAESNHIRAKVFPNPAQQAITIELPNNDAFSLEIHTHTGQKVFHKTELRKSYTLINNFDSGVYFITIKTQKGSTTQKVIFY